MYLKLELSITCDVLVVCLICVSDGIVENSKKMVQIEFCIDLIANIAIYSSFLQEVTLKVHKNNDNSPCRF